MFNSSGVWLELLRQSQIMATVVCCKARVENMYISEGPVPVIAIIQVQIRRDLKLQMRRDLVILKRQICRNLELQILRDSVLFKCAPVSM